MPIDATCSWLDEAVLDLEVLAREASPALRRRLEPAVGRIARSNGGESVRDALLRAGATPFVPVIEALARDLGLTGDPRVALVGRSTVLLYLYVRLQDDLVDEEALVDRPTVYAMEAVLARHLELLASAEVPPGVWVRRSRCMARFAGVSAEEADTRLDAVGLPAELAGEKFLAMAVPLVALASLAGRDELHDAVQDIVVHAGTALQMVNDVLNAPEDLLAGRTTPFLRWFGPAAAPADLAAAPAFVAAMRASMFGHAATRRALELARGEATMAVDRAEDLGLTHLAASMGALRTHASHTERRLFGLLLGEQV